MKRTLMLGVLSCALGASLLFPQTPAKTRNPANYVQHRVNFLTTLLSLTGAQQQQATSIFTSAASSDASVHGNMKTARQSLQTAVRNNDTGSIEQSSTTIGNLTAQLTLNQAKADAAFYQILTPDQQTKLTQFESQRHGQFAGARRGGGFHGGQ